MMTLKTLFAIASLSALTAIAQPQTSSFQLAGDTELSGETYIKFKMLGNKVSACLTMCEEDGKCQAFTVSDAGNGNAYCELKRNPGRMIANRPQSTSGIREGGSVGIAQPVDDSTAPPARTRASSTTSGARRGDGSKSAIMMREDVGVDPQELAKLRERFGGRAEVITAPVPPSATETARPAPAPADDNPFRFPGDGEKQQSQTSTPAAPPPAGTRRPAAAQTPPLTGRWKMIEENTTVQIEQESENELTFIDSENRRIQAKLRNGKVIVDRWSMEGTVVDSGKTIRWNNGSVWTRASSQP